MAAVLFEVIDGRGRTVEVRDERWQHIVERHPEMVGEEDALRRTVSDPDLVIRPQARPRGRKGIERRANCRLDAHSRYKGLYVIVPIEYVPSGRHWVVTAFVAPLPPKGTYVFFRIPHSWV